MWILKINGLFVILLSTFTIGINGDTECYNSRFSISNVSNYYAICIPNYTVKNTIKLNENLSINDQTKWECKMEPPLWKSRLKSLSLINEGLIPLHNRTLECIFNSTVIPYTRIETLYLNASQIESITATLFERFKNLRFLHLSENMISYVPDITLGNDIEDIYLQNNNIFNVEFDITKWKSFKKLDLSGNKIARVTINLVNCPNDCEIDLRNNSIKTVSLYPDKTSRVDLPLDVNVLLANNPLQCLCDFDFGPYKDNRTDSHRYFLDVEAWDIVCETPSGQKDLLKKRNPSQIACLRECPMEFSNKCVCYEKLDDGSLLINCSNQNLKEYPHLTNTLSIKPNIYVILENNWLNRMPTIADGYEIVTKLNLAFNQIMNISVLPTKLHWLNISFNKLVVDCKLLKYYEQLCIDMQGNQWDCCKNMKETNFSKHTNKLKQDFLCPLPFTIWQEQCSDSNTILYSTISFLLIVATTLLIVIICRKNRTNLHFPYELIPFSHMKINKGKKYDVFFLYSTECSNYYAIDRLNQMLRKKYRVLCATDFVAGDNVINSYATAINESQTIIIFLCDEYLRNSFLMPVINMTKKIELEDKILRLIVILDAEDTLLKINEMNNELSAYMLSKTYLLATDSNLLTRLQVAINHNVNTSATANESLI